MIEEVNLADVCDIIAGQSPPSSTYNQEGNGVPFFQGKADFGEIYPTVRYWCNSPKKMSKPDDILFSVRAPVGPTNINNITACIGRGLAAIRCNNIERNYLLHYLRGNEEKIASLGSGSTFKAITIGTLKEIKIPLPPLDQQKKIAAILDAADTYRQKTKALIEKYDELTQSLFLDMFGDPVTNPKGFEIKQLKEFGRIVTGNTPSRKNEKNYNSDYIEWIKTDNINSELLYVTKAKEYLSEEGLRNGRSVEAGSLLVACIAGSIKSIGRAALTNRKVAFNQQINAIEPSSNTNSQFLYHMFKSCPKYIQDHASHGMKRMLSKGDFQQIKIVLPPTELQNQFAERVQAIEAQKAQAQESLAKAEDLFNSLLQKAFKGELTS